VRVDDLRPNVTRAGWARNGFVRLRPHRDDGPRARQFDGERGAHAGLALHPDGAAVRLHDLTNDPKAQPESAVISVGLSSMEAFENARLLVGSNADAVITNAKAHFALVHAVDCDENRLVRPKLERV